MYNNFLEYKFIISIDLTAYTFFQKWDTAPVPLILNTFKEKKEYICKT
jgi:hypothetical protein